jgi:polyhydroxybutyrate depolymerase
MTRGVRGLILAVALLSCGGSPSDPGEGLFDGEGVLGEWVRAQLRTRTYQLHVPSGGPPPSGYPVVMTLHGAGGNGASMRGALGLDALADARGFVAVYPDGVQASWAFGCGDCSPAERAGVNDAYFLNTLLEHLSDHLSLDLSQIYLVGFSQGGMLAGYAACRSLFPVAGIGLVAATVVRPVLEWCDPDPPLSVVQIHGTADGQLPWNGLGQETPWPGVEEVSESFRGAAGCDPEPATEDLPQGAGELLRYSGCGPGGGVALYRLEGGGHNWPLDGAGLGLPPFVVGVSATDVLVREFFGEPS